MIKENIEPRENTINETPAQKDELSKKVEQILEKDNEDELSELWFTFERELQSDDECPDEKMRRILNAWLKNRELVDDLLITLCGWSLESLLKKAEQ